MAQQVANGNLAECKRKVMQFVTVFHLLRQGQPMIDFEGCKYLFDFLEVPNNPRKQWTYTTGPTWLKLCMNLCSNPFV
jgi:hypothetical protein